MILAEVHEMTRRFGRRTVLDRVSFEIRQGEVLGLIGPNGAGKTTLFECLAGLLAADSGAVRFGGAEVPGGRRKDHLFYLPDGIRPWPEQRVRDILGWHSSIYRVPAGGVIRDLGLEPLLPARMSALSKGELKRTLIAVARLSPRPLLLLDEPFDGLDLRQARELMARLRDVPKSGKTLFLSIHQLSDAARVCDRFILLSNGRLVAHGALEELRVLTGLSGAGMEEVFLALT